MLKRIATRSVLLVGAALALVALVVFAGWATHNLALIQVVPGGSAMRLNTAAMFLLVGASFAALVWQRWWLMRTLGLAVAAFCAATIFQYFTRMDLGIDNLLVRDWTDSGPNPPGRMAINTGIAFVLVGLVLSSMSLPNRFRWQRAIEGVLASIVLGVGTMTAIGYLSGAAAGYGWGAAAGMAVHTATAIALTGGAIVFWAIASERQETGELPTWLPLPAGIAVLTAGGVLWQAIGLQEQVQIDRNTELRARNLAARIESHLRDRRQSLERMAHRWVVGGAPTREAWEADAGMCLRHMADIRSIAWVSPEHRLTWLAPLEGNESVLGIDVCFEPRRRAAFERAVESRQVTMTRTIDLVQGAKGVVINAPIYRDDRFEGCYTAAFVLTTLLGALAKSEADDGYAVELLDGHDVVYQATLSQGMAPVNHRYAGANVAETGWTVRLKPTLRAVATQASTLPTAMLLASLLMAGLVALVTHYALRVSHRSQAAEEAVEALRRSEERYEIAVRGSFQGLWDWDIPARAVHYAPQCKTLLGFAPDDPVMELAAWTSRIHPDDREQVMAAMDDHLLRRTPFNEEFRLVVGLETVRWVRARGQAIWNEHGFPIRMAGSLTDVSDRRQLEDQLRHLVEKLAASNRDLQEYADAANAATRSKSEFLANMSHEIRSPLTAVLGYTDLLLEQEPTDEARSSLERIKRNGEHLLAVINDILDLSKIEAGKVELENSLCSTVEIFTQVIELMQVRSQAKSLPLSLEFQSAIPAKICTDPLRLRQILINLVGNAIKFTERGAVRLVVRATGGLQPLLSIDIIDTGIGLAPEHLERLFQPFTQADSSMARRFGGTGLGLTISQRLAGLLGGKITVTSKLGEGSVFRVQIPVGPLNSEPWIWGAPPRAAAFTPDTNNRPAQTARRQVAMAESGDKPLSGRRVLLAEDGPDNQWLVSHLLGQAGATVEVVGDGQQAMDVAKSAWRSGLPFDAVLMDMQMPVLDGYEATRRLRAAGYELPIVALTAHAMAEDRRKCLDAGCDDYAAKPIQLPQLLATLAACFSRRETAVADASAALATSSSL